MADTDLIERATKAIDLLPCPFCGGTPELMDTLPSGSYWYRCEECCGETEGGKTHAEAIAAWNRRAPSPSPAPGVVEALKRLAYEQAKDNHGYRVAGDLVANGWRWPDTAPDFVDTSLHEAIAALASLSQPAKERKGGEI